jgi:hypothetical protein
MTDQQLKDYCEAEFENIDKVVMELLSVVRGKGDEPSIIELAAIATFIHNFYNGVENILKRVLFYKQIEVKDTPTWHKDLLKASFESGIISTDLYNYLSNYLSFRHFFVHAYSFDLNWEDMKPLVDSIEEIRNQFRQTIYDYIG